MHPESHEGTIGGQLFGALGSALGLSAALNATLTGVLGFLIPGLGAFFGTIIGTMLGDAIAGDPASPKSVHDVRILDGVHFQNRFFGSDDHGNEAISQAMGDQVTTIANSYLDAVKGAGIHYSGKVMIGYNAGAAPYSYITGWFPNGAGPVDHFAQATDAIQQGVRELLRNTEVIGGDLILKRAHQAFINGPHPEPTETSPDFSDLIKLGGDLSVAQDYENYLNNREAINALIVANPDTAFAAGWIATFARVNDLGLNHAHASDFIGGLVGYLDSVAKAGLGAAAANASVGRAGNGSVIVEVKVANGTEVPGALSVFADQVNIVSGATGQTVQFTVDGGLAARGYNSLGADASGGDGLNDLWLASAGAEHIFTGSGGHDILVGGSMNDVIHAGAGWDFVDGGYGNDYLFGQDGGDILRGGRGTDFLFGGAGNDTYAFTRGDGVDRVSDDAGTAFVPDSSFPGGGHDEQLDAGADTLAFGAGISPGDIRLQFSGADLIVGVKDPAHPGVPFGQLADNITLENWTNPLNRIEYLRFADGTTLNIGAALGAYQVPFGAALSRSGVVERSAIGTEVGTVTGFDFNPDASLSYSLDNDAGGHFAIDASTGVVTVAGSIDYDDAHSWQIAVRVSDGTHAAGQVFTINVIDVPNRAPVLSVPATVTASAGQPLQASSLFSAVDADGDALTYFFQDGTSAANSGRFVLNGTAMAQGAGFNVSAAQLAQLTFVARSVDDNLSMQLADSHDALSAAAGFHVHVNQAPVLTVPAGTVTANANQSLQVSGLFSAVDAEGDPLTYFFQDGTSAANSGRFVLNGTPYAQGAAFNVSAAQLAQLTFVAGGVDDNLSMQLADDAEARWGHRSLNRNRRAMARSRVRGSGWRHARGAGASFACVHKRFA